MEIDTADKCEYYLTNLGAWLRSIPDDTALSISTQPMFREYRSGWRRTPNVPELDIEINIDDGFRALDMLRMVSADKHREWLFMYYCETASNMSLFCKIYEINDRTGGKWTSEARGAFSQIYSIIELLKKSNKKNKHLIRREKVVKLPKLPQLTEQDHK